MTQDDVFAGGEGDEWFRRNRAALGDETRLAHDPVMRLLQTVSLQPRRVLEIGASNGYRLDALHRAFRCDVTGVEPSQEAIDDGARRFPAVRFVRGVAGDIPLDEQFDLVIVNFVLHWIDRSTLMRSAAEIDRMVADGGFLVIGDFFPSHPQRVPYHHLPGQNVATYKQPYGELFTATNLYQQVAALVFDHSTHELRPDAPPHDRGEVSLLRKSLNGRYAE